MVEYIVKGSKKRHHVVAAGWGTTALCSHCAELVGSNTFPGRWIGRRGPVEWPPRSPDLTPLDFWLWGYLKDKVYRHRIHNIPELREAITEEFRKIPLDMCKKACDNVKLRLEACIAMEGRMVDHSMENRV